MEQHKVPSIHYGSNTMESNYDGGVEIRSAASSPSFEWGLEGNNRDTFEPVSLFDTNSVVETAAEAQDYCNVDPPRDQAGEKRSADIDLDCIPTISRRKKKAKGMPKRPMNSYALFFSQERAKLVEADGNPKVLSYEELEKIIGMRWRGLSAEERQEYEGLALQDTERYRTEMETFNGEKQKKQNRETPQLRPQEKATEQQPILPHPPHSASHAHSQTMGGYMPTPTSPSSSRQPMYGAMHMHAPVGYHPEHYPTSPPSMPRGYHNEPPPPHYYSPPIHASGHPHPPPPSHSESYPTMDRGLFPIPPGMELMLPDRDGRERKYKVQYKWFVMKKEEAQDYVDRLSNVISRGRPAPPPPPIHQTRADPERSPLSRPPTWGGSY